MYVISWIKPGLHPNGLASAAAFDLKGIILGLETHLIDANIALNCFTSSRRLEREGLASRWQDGVERREEVERRLKLARESAGGFTQRKRDLLAAEIELDLKRQSWTGGTVPNSHLARTPFVHANSFLDAVHLFGRTLSHVAQFASNKEAANDALAIFGEFLPNLAKVRNSAQHIDERRLKLRAENGKRVPIEPRGLKHSTFRGRPFFIDQVSDNKLGYTIDDGSFAEVEISPKTVDMMLDTLKAVYALFDWEPLPRPMPD